MEATRLKREEDRIKRLEDEEVSSAVLGTWFGSTAEKILNFRLSADVLMRRNRPTRMS